MIYNEQIEREYVAMALSPIYRTDALWQVTANDFYVPECRKVFESILRARNSGTTIDHVTIGAATKLDGLNNWYCPVLPGVDSHAQILRDLALCRRTLQYAEALRDTALEGDADRLAALAGNITTAIGEQRQIVDPALEASELAAMEFEDRWLIPALMERADRVMVTGGEGKGKSLFLRQFGVMCASGIHPFKRTNIDPLHVLVVDLENSRPQISRSLKNLLARAGGRYEHGMMHVECRPQGMDLAVHADVRWLDGLMAYHKPDLMVFGSLYKAFKGSEGRSKSGEEASERVTNALDELRVRHDCALLIEAHAPHGDGGDRAGLRPAGSSAFMRWPEAGIGLKVGVNGDADLVRWRDFRDAARELEWPRVLVRGNVWPWEAVWR